MDVRVTVAGDDAADQLLGLRAWLLREDALRGAVSLCVASVARGELGTGTDTLQVVAGSVSSAFVASLVAWLRTRVGAVRLVMRDREGAEITLEARTVRALDTAGLAELTSTLTSAVEATGEQKRSEKDKKR
ncbi:hypothetical protein ACTOB_006057 [Actinoplanes oblitus]|uniref:STAS domain-containing protein n=1 Tax=Actinoplanes oblitus TaxID=3040509 RepID=A0ABY8W978_9ACTN|nr:hypothetical protein [Actinoplanes oblitus]WIM94057.1 hypothetical protein ACTOB_006057 [Actinoplanes oblitus]